jgi:hypothetical protein
MLISKGYTFKKSETSAGYYRITQDIFPIWNIKSDKICDRAICVVRRNINIYSEVEKKYKDTDIIQFEIVQSYISTTTDSGQKLEKARKVGEKMYNKLYYDQTFEDMFVDNLISKYPEKRNITYAFAQYKDDKSKTGYRTEYNDLNSYIKKYQFLQSDFNNINLFLGELYDRFEISFNFRSDIAASYNVDNTEQGDVEFIESKSENTPTYPIGEYEYRFIKTVPKSVIDLIPYVIRKTSEGLYGGLVTSQPLVPVELTSFGMKPYKFDNEIYVKITLASLNDDQKREFVKELEDLADVKNADALEIGKYVKTFLSKSTVGADYFFGDLRMSDYGKIFQEYALKQDLAKLIFDEEIEPLQVKTEVNLDDAESFIIKLYSLI